MQPRDETARPYPATTTTTDEPLPNEPLAESREVPPPGVGPGLEYEREYQRGYQAPPDDATEPFAASPEPADRPTHPELADERADTAGDADDRAADEDLDLADEPADTTDDAESLAADQDLAGEPADTAEDAEDRAADEDLELAGEPADTTEDAGDRAADQEWAGEPTDTAAAEPLAEPPAELPAEQPTWVPADVVVATVAAAALPGAAVEQPLITAAETTGLRSRWRDIQAGFVDDPDQAVRQASELVDEVVRTLTSTLTDARRGLDDWAGDEPPTEQLRVVLRRYRTAFDRLLAD